MVDAGNEISLGRMVTLLIAKLHEEKVELPFRDQEPWHLLFYALKSEPAAPGKPEFLSDLVFDWDGPSPRCEELSEYLNGLHISANVAGLNPRFEQISVDSDDATRWAEELEELDPEARAFVQRAADVARVELTA